MMFSLFMLVPIVLLSAGIVGIFRGRKNIILMIISLELMLLSVSFHYLLIGWGLYGDFKAVLLTIFLLSIGAAESAIGLALAISYYKYRV